MLNEEQTAKLMRTLSVVFPVLLCVLLALLVGAVHSVASEVQKATAQAATGPMLPAGIYICDGERCVIANSDNIDGVADKK